MINQTSRENTNIEGVNLQSSREKGVHVDSINESQIELRNMPGEGATEFTNASQTSTIKEIFAEGSVADFSSFFSLATLENENPPWESTDLQAILSHQLSTPMTFDFCATIKSWVATEETRTWPAEKAVHPKSFQDLFTHFSPSIRLLNLTKQFAKANWEHPESLLPREIAVVLYYTSIAVAYVRRGEWITKLSPGDAKSGFMWIQSQSWVDKGTKDICLEAVESLN